MKATNDIVYAMRASRDWREDPEVKEHFPVLNPSVIPLGARVLVQFKSQPNTSKGGIILVEETKALDKWNLQVARVLALGDIAFCNRETGEPWREGAWCQPGDFVIVPRWGGNRRNVAGPTGELVTFATFNDHEIIEKVFGNPLELETYYL